MGFWLLLALVVATVVLTALLAPRLPGAKPSALGDFQAPTAEEGRIIPVIFGRVKIAGPNVTWYGDLRIRPIKVRSGWFGLSKTTVGYRYFLGMQLALCHGIIEQVGTHIVGSGSGHAAFYYSRPLGNWFWAVKWSSFPTPTLPGDAVVQGIYGVARTHRVTGPGLSANANVNAGTNLNPWSLSPGGFVIKQGAGGVNWDGQFHVTMPGWTLGSLPTATMFLRLASSLFINDMDDDLFVTALGFAIYYTSAEPVIETGELDPPFAVPGGQGLAWTYPNAVEAHGGIPGYPNGSAEGTASSTAFDTLELYAGQTPDDVRVLTTVVSQDDDVIQFQMYAPELFGGERREGGLSGTIYLYRGSQTQPSDSYLSSKLGITFPQYHGLCYAVLRGCYLGTANYLKNLNFVLRRYPSNLGLSASVTRIAGDANPVEIIYEAMTNTVWGLGIPASRFDLTSWQAAAITVASEGLGMSLTWDNDAEADELIGDVLRHIDGVIQTDPRTGLWIFTLARADYDPETTLELGEPDLLEAPELSRGSWEETWNEVKITYLDRATWKKRTVQAHDAANEQVMAGVRTQSMEFLGFTNAALATRIAMRELKTHSYPFAKVRVKAKRKAWALRVGSVFKLSWPPTGIAATVVRVLNIDYGQFDKGIIEIDAVEDAFAVAYTAFDAPADSAWVDPIADPEPPAAQLLVEAPFEWLAAPVTQERILVGCVRGDWSSRGYEIHADEGSGFYKSNTADRFCPSGILTADYLRTTSALDATGFTLQSEKDLDVLAGTDAAGRVRGDCLLLFEDTGEICAFQTATDNGDSIGTFDFTNIVRGVYDTLPADHPAPDSIQEGRVFILRDEGTWFLFPYKADEAESIEAGGDQFIVEED